MNADVFRENGEATRVLVLPSWREADSQISAGCSTRLGGVSGGAMASLNCGLHVGDEPDRVLENRRRVAQCAGFPFDAWTCAEQVHGGEALAVAREHRGKGRKSMDDAIAGKDALVTNEAGVMLAAVFADCVPLYFFDPVRRAVGLAHAGWRGTACNIAKAAVEAMNRAYGSEAEHMLAAIGPAIGPCCYEVDRAVIDRMAAALNRDMDGGEARAALRLAVEDKGSGRFMLDLKELNRQFMIKAGILPTRIECSERCTSCQNDLLFSHRRQRGNTGRMAAWIGLKAEVNE